MENLSKKITNKAWRPGAAMDKSWFLFSSATEESYPQLHTRTLDWDTLYVHKGSAYILIKWNRKALK